MKVSVKQGVLFVGLIATLAATAWVHQQKQRQIESEALELLVEPTSSAEVTQKTMNHRPDSEIAVQTEFHMKMPMQSNAELLNTKSQNTMDLFKPHQWMPPVQEVTNLAESLVPEPPPIPVMPFLYLGKFEDKSGLVVYLMDGDVLLKVSKGEVIDQSYRLDSISDNSLVLTYLPQNVRQTLYIKRNS